MTLPTPKPRSAGLLPTVALLVLAGTVGYLTHRVIELESTLATSMDRIDRALKLARIESETKIHGVDAILAHIAHWAPVLVKSSTSAPEARKVRKRLDDAIAAIDELGSNSFATFEAKFAEAEDPQERRWLMKAMLAADSTQGIAALSEITRGLKHQPDPATRIRAAKLLLEADKHAAGEAMKDVLVYESQSGLRDLPPQMAKRYEQFVHAESFPMYYNFIDPFVRSGHPDVESTLLRIVLSENHGMMTYKTCIKQLADLGSKDALNRIKQLFQRPPFGFADALFLNACLDAIAKIEGEPAADYFEQLLLEPQQPIVKTRLQHLIKQLRSGE